MKKVLVVNCGSSSVKYKVFAMPAEQLLAAGAVERVGSSRGQLLYAAGATRRERTLPVTDHRHALSLVAENLLDGGHGVIGDVAEVGGVGHRVVHGGEDFNHSVRVDAAVLAAIRRCSPLAPLHNPHNLAGIEAAAALFPRAPQVAVFDTAFHGTIPPRAFRYAIPERLYREHRLRRYGFHGTSHRHAAGRAAAMLGRPLKSLNAITCHLGSGCSITAVEHGLSVDTSMGLTPLEGLVMGTRCGDLDPGLILHLGDQLGLDSGAIGRLLNRDSGLLGLSGLSADARDLEAAAGRGEAPARLALEIFAYRVRKYIGAYFFVLGRVDALVFTGGIGENSPHIRRLILEDSAPLGIVLDAGRNGRAIARQGGEGAITTPGSPITALVVPADEERCIAQDTYQEVRDD